jgi:hypothetical protein
MQGLNKVNHFQDNNFMEFSFSNQNCLINHFLMRLTLGEIIQKTTINFIIHPIITLLKDEMNIMNRNDKNFDAKIIF